MKRGHIANTRSPSLWVMSDVLLEQQGRIFWVGPQREALRRQDWLWRVSNDFQVVVIYIDRPPSKELSDYTHERFSNFQQARIAFNADMRAGLMIVDDPSMATPPNIVSFSRSAGIF